ncbi:TPA: hypothetical protein QHC35_005456, partial [Klebsiella pneumoniae subsp. pneumoniae]|nr:hypothetical protein [Klebsiella pneumoniae subsp. pneumoniae]
MNALKSIFRFVFKTTTDTRASLQAQVKVLEAQNATNNFRMNELNEQIAYMTKTVQSIQTQVSISNKAIDSRVRLLA